MSTRSTSYAAAIEHLPAGAMLVIPGITWEAYERLLDEVGDRPGVRLSYDEGTLHVGQRQHVRRVPAGRFFPALTATLLTELLETSKAAGQMHAIEAFRARVRARCG
jgi:hypothetical protein